MSTPDLHSRVAWANFFLMKLLANPLMKQLAISLSRQKRGK